MLRCHLKCCRVWISFTMSLFDTPALPRPNFYALFITFFYSKTYTLNSKRTPEWGRGHCTECLSSQRNCTYSQSFSLSLKVAARNGANKTPLRFCSFDCQRERERERSFRRVLLWRLPLYVRRRTVIVASHGHNTAFLYRRRLAQLGTRLEIKAFLKCLAPFYCTRHIKAAC